MYSIDPSVKTVYSTFTVDKYLADDIPIEQLTWEAHRTNLNQILMETGPTTTDLVVRFYPPEPAGKFNLRISAAAIPGEYARLMDRIDNLENEVRWRKRDSLYAPVYDMGARRES